MATLHIRNVPEEVVEALKRRAKLHGRSLNAEVVQTLTEAAPRPQRTIEDVVVSVRRRAASIANPPSADEIVVEIRHARQERAARLDESALGAGEPGGAGREQEGRPGSASDGRGAARA
jgi:plasmid stability protein